MNGPTTPGAEGPTPRPDGPTAPRPDGPVPPGEDGLRVSGGSRRGRWRAQLRDLLGMRPSGRRVTGPDGTTAVSPPPRIVLPLAGAVAGAVVRLLPAVFATACGALLDAGPTILVLMVLGGVALTIWPQRPIAAPLLLLVGLVVFAGPDLLGTGTVGAGGAAASGGWLRLGVLVLCAHLMVRSAALAAHVAWRGLVEVAVLKRAAWSVLGIQVVVQGLLLAVVWFRAGVGGIGGQGWLRLLAVLAVVVVTAVLVPRAWLRRADRDWH